MAYFLLSNLSLSLSPFINPLSKSKPNNRIRCGPRSNRGPLLKGRTLSSEAIQAVQIIKRHRSNDPNSLSKTLSRLIKSDLVAVFKELLRQEELDLAVRVFKEVREEYGCDFAAYADLVLALDRGKRGHDIDVLIVDLDEAERGGDMEGRRTENREGEERGSLSPCGSFRDDSDKNERGYSSRLSPTSSFPDDLDETERGYSSKLSSPDSFPNDRGANEKDYSSKKLSPPDSFPYDVVDENEKGYSSRKTEHGSFSGGNESSYKTRLFQPSSFQCNDSRGLARLVKALIAAGRGESTVRVYEMMKRNGWGSDRTVEDEYLGRVLERGFKRFGEKRLAKEVRDLFGGVLEKDRV